MRRERETSDATTPKHPGQWQKRKAREIAKKAKAREERAVRRVMGDVADFCRRVRTLNP